ncbi:MAG TPA: leucine-rich repeat domain-containing protein [Anaerolineae bacterium]|nr:leucine-rich repeat domain-containing protein [Anaerolineae bacterium]
MTKSRRLKIICHLLILCFFGIQSVFAGRHIGGLGPTNQPAIWGAAPAGTRVTLTRTDNNKTITACSYLHDSSSDCPSSHLGPPHNDETFPYYALGLGHIISDVLDSNGALTQPITLTFTITPPNTTTPFHQQRTIHPIDFDQWHEIRVDLTPPQPTTNKNIGSCAQFTNLTTRLNCNPDRLQLMLSPCSTITEISLGECEALFDIYQSTNGAQWTNGWFDRSPYPDQPCRWWGIDCNFDNQVQGLLTSNNNMNGPLPATIEQLPHLSKIWVYGNQITWIPPEIGNLPNLTQLWLDNNRLFVIPAEIGNLTNLESLILSNNQLTTIPPEIGNLANLLSLNLNNNQLTTLPPEIGNLANLLGLYLDHNQLITIPVEIGNLANLTALHLGHNQLITIPVEIGNLANLQTLHMNNNQITGNIPAYLCEYNSLNNLDLGHNHLTATPEVSACITPLDPDWYTTQTYPLTAPTPITSPKLNNTPKTNLSQLPTPAITTPNISNKIPAATSATPISATATSTPITPTNLLNWQNYHLTTTIPASTTLIVSLLTTDMSPIPGFTNIPLSSGPNTLDLTTLAPALYPALRLQLTFTTHDQNLSPQLNQWQLDWTEPFTPYQIVGEVYDGFHHPLAGATAFLLTDGVIITQTEVAANGRYHFLNLTPQLTTTYQIRVALQNPTFQLQYAPQSTYSGPIPYLQTPPFTLNPDTLFTTHVANFDFATNQTNYTTNIPDPARLDDLAAIHHHVHQATHFIETQLTTTLTPFTVNAYANGSAVYYDEAQHAIIIGHGHADYYNGNRPMNREWHETFHALMRDTIGIPPSVPYPTTNCQPGQPANHGGYNNCSTSDSWVEGYAEFWTAVLWDHMGWPKPELYRLGDASSQTAISLEYNWQVWDRGCDQSWCPSREEFAIASLFWDLYDTNQSSTPDDYLAVPLTELWAVLGTTNYTPMQDMKDVYDALTLANIGQSDSNPVDACGLNDLDELFVAHGIYHDSNGNRQYECTEEIGRAADANRPDRRQADLVDAYINLDVTTPGGTAEAITITVFIYFPIQPELSYSYDIPATANQTQQLHLEPPPSRTSAIILLFAQSATSQNSTLWQLTNTDYWDAVNNLTDTTQPVFDHTIHINPPQLNILAVTPQTITNDQSTPITITIDTNANTQPEVWLGAYQLIVNSHNSTTIEAVVPPYLPADTYTLRIKYADTNQEVLHNAITITTPSQPPNTLGLTHNTNPPNDLTTVYVTADTQNNIYALHLTIEYPPLLLDWHTATPSYATYNLDFTSHQPEPGRLILYWAGDGTHYIPAGQDPLAALNFQVDNYWPLPGTTIPLSYTIATLISANGQALPVTTHNGQITVCSDCTNMLTLGDITHDNQLSLADYDRLIAIIMEHYGPNNIEAFAADINQDEAINVLDAITLINNISPSAPAPLLTTSNHTTLTLQSPLLTTNTIRLPLGLNTSTPLAALQMDIRYNPNLILTDIHPGNPLTNMTIDTRTSARGLARLVFTSPTTHTIPTGSDQLVEPIFTTPSPTTTPPNLNIIAAVAGDTTAQLVPTTIYGTHTNFHATVTPATTHLSWLHLNYECAYELHTSPTPYFTPTPNTYFDTYLPPTTNLTLPSANTQFYRLNYLNCPATITTTSPLIGTFHFTPTH